MGVLVAYNQVHCMVATLFLNFLSHSDFSWNFAFLKVRDYIRSWQFKIRDTYIKTHIYTTLLTPEQIIAWERGFFDF